MFLVLRIAAPAQCLEAKSSRLRAEAVSEAVKCRECDALRQTDHNI